MVNLLESTPLPSLPIWGLAVLTIIALVIIGLLIWLSVWTFKYFNRERRFQNKKDQIDFGHKPNWFYESIQNSIFIFPIIIVLAIIIAVIVFFIGSV